MAAQLVHVGAVVTPWIRDVPGIAPVSIEHWFELLLMTLGVAVVMEFHKAVLWWRGRRCLLNAAK